VLRNVAVTAHNAVISFRQTLLNDRAVHCFSGARPSNAAGRIAATDRIAGSKEETLTGGSGTNDILKSAFANTTFIDGTGAYQELIGSGGSSIFNLGNGSNDTVNLKDSGHNVINISANGGNVNIEGLTATDVIHFGDTFADATITTAKGYITVAFKDGQTATLNGVHDAAVRQRSNYLLLRDARTIDGSLRYVPGHPSDGCVSVDYGTSRSRCGDPSIPAERYSSVGPGDGILWREHEWRRQFVCGAPYQ
jgi:hypothetical protein